MSKVICRPYAFWLTRQKHMCKLSRNFFVLRLIWMFVSFKCMCFAVRFLNANYDEGRVLPVGPLAGYYPWDASFPSPMINIG